MPTALDAAVAYRRLQSEEWEKLRPVYASQGAELPSPEYNGAIVAEVDGQIVGMNGLNLIIHAGPLWVHPDWRRLGIATRMGQELDALIKGLGEAGYYSFPSNRNSEAIMQKLGMERLDWTVYRRIF